MTGTKLTRLAEDIVEISMPDPVTARQIAEDLREAGCFEEVVPALTNITVMFSPFTHSFSTIERVIGEQLQSATSITQPSAAEITLPIIYGGTAGPDLEHVAEALGLSPDEVISTHAAQTYTVDMMGFTPGFAYLSGCEWSVPRLSTPKPYVSAGSVGVAGSRTGVYSLSGPGGWPIIGRTSAALFDAENSKPFLLSAGSKIRFRSVNA